MASPAQVANDLNAQAERLRKTHMKDVANSCARGAETIRELLKVIADLEAAAQDEADRFERYRHGYDDHGE